MKKLKLLAGLSTLGVLGGSIALSATSCTWTYKGGNSNLDPNLKISINGSTSEVTAIIGSNNLEVTVSYSGQTGITINKIVSVSSDDESIFTVESYEVTSSGVGNIKINGKKAGTAYLTVVVTDSEGHTNKSKIKVTVSETGIPHMEVISNDIIVDARMQYFAYANFGSFKLYGEGGKIITEDQSSKQTLSLDWASNEHLYLQLRFQQDTYEYFVTSQDKWETPDFTEESTHTITVTWNSQWGKFVDSSIKFTFRPR